MDELYEQNDNFIIIYIIVQIINYLYVSANAIQCHVKELFQI